MHTASKNCCNLCPTNSAFFDDVCRIGKTYSVNEFDEHEAQPAALEVAVSVTPKNRRDECKVPAARATLALCPTIPTAPGY